MKVLIFGATGMVGQGVCASACIDPQVELVVTIGRTSGGQNHSRVPDPDAGDCPSNLADLSSVESDLAGFDACFFTLGVSSSGMKEADYDRITYGITLSAARTAQPPQSGNVPSSTSPARALTAPRRARVMWARVKGRTENALLRLPLDALHVPPRHHPAPRRHPVKDILVPHRLHAHEALLPLLHWALPNQVLSTREIGRPCWRLPNAVTKSGFSRPEIFASLRDPDSTSTNN